MLPVYFRIFSKLALFVFGFFFIVFFVVYGYRYDKNVGFVQKNVYLEFKFWGEKQTLKFDGNNYVSDDNYLRFYNMGNGCYNVVFQGDSYKECIGDDESYYDVFISLSGTKNLGKKLYQTLDKVEFVYFRPYSINQRTFSTPIQNAYRYNEINFVQTDNKLFYCTDDYVTCKFLTQVEGDVAGANKKGIVYFDEKTGYNIISLK